MVRQDVTLRIDRELRAQAREFQINMSRTLERALRGEISRVASRREILESGSEEIRLDLEDDQGRSWIGRFSGKPLGSSGVFTVFLTDDERVIVYDEARLEHREIEDLGDLRSVFADDLDFYINLMHALSETPEIDL